MRVLLRLFSTEEKASDGSTISRPKVEEYLNSSDYKLIIANKLSLGGVTHKDRGSQQLETYESIGEDDPILITDNVTHYITKIFFKDASDPICYAEIELFNPDDFSGKRRDNIMNLSGMLKSGSFLPISVVIQAVWSSMEDCEKIIRIKGLDFTLNPSFPSAGVVKVYSKKTLVSSARTISNPTNTKIKTKVYSSTILPEIPMEPDTTDLNSREYKLKYGLKNKSVNPMRYDNDDLEGSVIETGDSDISEIGDLSTKSYSYSIPGIEARMRMIDIDPKNLLARLINSYKSYYKYQCHKLNERQLKFLKLIFIQDINYILRLQLDKIVKGTNLASQLGLARYNDRELQKITYILGIKYRRAIIANRNLDFIPKNIYNDWLTSLENFYNKLSGLVFNSELSFTGFDFMQDKSFSGYAEIGVALDQQQDYKSIKNKSGETLGGSQFITIIDPAFGVGSNFQNYFCHE